MIMLSDRPKIIFPQYFEALRFWWWCPFLHAKLKTWQKVCGEVVR